MKHTKDYEKALLVGWEDVYRKSQLTLWLLVSLKAGEKHMAEIKSFVEQITNHMLSPDDKSMYRALRRYTDAELIDFRKEASVSGPELKIYQLTDIGSNVLKQFIERNITKVFYTDSVKELITKGN